MILIDTTFFAHTEAKNKKLTYSTSIFTADLLDAFAALGMSDKFCLIVNFNHLDFFKERFPSYKIISAHWWPVTLLYKLTKGQKNCFLDNVKQFGEYYIQIDCNTKYNMNTLKKLIYRQVDLTI